MQTFLQNLLSGIRSLTGYFCLSISFNAWMDFVSFRMIQDYSDKMDMISNLHITKQAAASFTRRSRFLSGTPRMFNLLLPFSRCCSCQIPSLHLYQSYMPLHAHNRSSHCSVFLLLQTSDPNILFWSFGNSCSKHTRFCNLSRPLLYRTLP